MSQKKQDKGFRFSIRKRSVGYVVLPLQHFF